MGKRGPVPKKNFLKAMSGNLPMTKDNMADTMINIFTPPDAPEHLSPEEKMIWDRTLELLRPLKHLEVIDGAILGAYCCSYVRWCDAEKELRKAANKQKKGLVTIGANGTWVTNPLVNISRRAQADMVTFAAQLGMTPAARLRVVIQKPSKEENPFENIKKR